MRALREVLNIHVEEVDFLWTIRDAAVHAPQYLLRDLSALDQRIEAHLDGLRIAGSEVWKVCKEASEWTEAGEIFGAAILSVESGDERRWAAILEAGTASIERSRGLVSALAWVDCGTAGETIRRLLQVDNPRLRRVGVAASAAHRLDPGDVLSELLLSQDHDLCARSLRAAGELGRTDLLSRIESRLAFEDGHVRFWAAWSATILGATSGAPVLAEEALRSEVHAERAVDVAFRRLDPALARNLIDRLAGDPRKIRLAVKGAGASGDPVHIPWLVEMIRTPGISRIAGEAFSNITGIDLRSEGLAGPAPVGIEAGPTENPEEEEVAMDPDDSLPWPDFVAVASMWSRRRAEWAPGMRLLLGRPITREALWVALRDARQRQRAAAALELAFLDPGKPLFEVRARGDRQRAMLC